MLSRIATMLTAVSLALTAQASAASPARQKNCPGKSHQAAKVSPARVAAAKPAGKWGGGGATAQMRRAPDIQILSFGP